ncbi:hypothetical protein ABZ820_12715 [Streptomyces diacarni]|uniref:hypothetical protein n=1 Tax=Streptomyces diacarni TaxID=2800381 RepID=UPI0033E4C4C8
MSTETPEQQPRIPGVRYRKVTRRRMETTTIDGQPETREVEYRAWEPVPPRDLDDMVLRAVTGVAIAVTALAVAGTTASVGGLLSYLVPSAVAFSVALVFDAVWLACLGVEWLERLDPKRAWPARTAGWVALLISMGAVFAYGHTLGQPVAGGAAAAVGLLAKGLWALVLRHYAVPLSDSVAFWLRRQEERITVRATVSARLRRLNRHDAYLRAAFPETSQAAEVITTTTETPRLEPRPEMPARMSGQAPDTSVPVPGQPPAPVPAAKTEKAPTPPPAPPGPPAAPGSAETPTERPQAGAEPPAAGPAPGLHSVGVPSIAGTVREVLAEAPDITDNDLIARVGEVCGDGGDPVKFAATVTRTRSRIEKKQKRNAS